MEMDLTAAGPPISDDDSELEETERKFVKVSLIFLFDNVLRMASEAIYSGCHKKYDLLYVNVLEWEPFQNLKQKRDESGCCEYIEGLYSRFRSIFGLSTPVGADSLLNSYMLRPSHIASSSYNPEVITALLWLPNDRCFPSLVSSQHDSCWQLVFSASRLPLCSLESALSLALSPLPPSTCSPLFIRCDRPSTSFLRPVFTTLHLSLETSSEKG